MNNANEFENSMYSRTSLLVGVDGINKLQHSNVLIVGIGGVGSFAAEALVRAGVGNLTLIDHDCVDITNINRQIHATMNSLNLPKVEVMKNRLESIQPEVQITIKQEFLLPENIEFLLGGTSFDYIIDAVDTVSAKLAIIQYAKNNNISVISSMGTANKLDATKFEVTDISKTHTCPLARVMRQELKKRGIMSGVEVLYSTALPVYKPQMNNGIRPIPGSISYVPSVAGLLLAGHVIQELLK